MMGKPHLQQPRPEKPRVESGHPGLRETTELDAGDTASDTPTAAGLMPQFFGRYEIKEELGRGGMGAVYLARDTRLHRDVALKVPKFGKDATAKSIARFYREARSAANLSHPNICQVFDVGEIDGTHYIAMARIKGQPLSCYIDRAKPLNPRVAAGIVRKVALALHEAHLSGIIHRDIKTANVMIDHRNEPIVMDFGLAVAHESRKESRLTQDGDLLGSPAYMSPEQLQGQLDLIGPRSDVYALGVVLYELLSGRLPFVCQGSTIAMIGRILSQPPIDLLQLRPNLDKNLAGVCRKAMSKKTRRRYDTMLQFANELSIYLKATQSQSDLPTSDPSKKSVAVAQIQIHEKAKIAKSLWDSKEYAAVVPVLKQIVDNPHAKGSRALAFAKSLLPKAEQELQKSQDRSQPCPTDGTGASRWPVKRIAFCCIATAISVLSIYVLVQSLGFRGDYELQDEIVQTVPQLTYTWPNVSFEHEFEFER